MDVIPLELEPEELARYEPLHRRYLTTMPNCRLAATESTEDDPSYRHKVAVVVQDVRREAQDLGDYLNRAM